MKRNTCFAFVLALALAVVAQDKNPVTAEKMTKDQQEKTENLIKEGDQLKKDGKNDEAAKKYQEAIDEADKGINVPDNPNVKDKGKTKPAKARYNSGVGAGTCAQTSEQGDVQIGDAGLHFKGKPSAGWLRSTKGHEYTHYRQICNRWGADGDLMQLEAMTWEVDNGDNNLLTDEEKEANKKLQERYKKALSEEAQNQAAKGDYSQPCTIGKGERWMDRPDVLQTDNVFVPDRPDFEDTVFSTPTPDGKYLVGAGGVALILATLGIAESASPNHSSSPNVPKVGHPNAPITAYHLADVPKGSDVAAITSDGTRVDGTRLTKQGDYIFQNKGKVIEKLQVKGPGGTKEIPTPYLSVQLHYAPVRQQGQALHGEATYEASEAFVGKKIDISVQDTTGVFNPAAHTYTCPVTTKKGILNLDGVQTASSPGQAKINTNVQATR